MSLIYGRYSSRVRHSILRRPFVGGFPYVPPSNVFEFTQYLARIVPPGIVVAEPYYCVQLVRTPIAGSTTSIICTKVVRPGTFYVPPEWCYTKYGGYICDYIATLISTSIVLPDRLSYNTDAYAEIRGLPTYSLTTSYLATISDLPVAISQSEYLVLVRQPSVVQSQTTYINLIALPHIVFEISGHDLEIKALPRYADEVDFYVEISPVRMYRAYGLYDVSETSVVARANVNVVTSVSNEVSLVPIDRLVPVEMYTDASISVSPYRTLRGLPYADATLFMFRDRMRHTTYTSYYVYPSYSLTGAYIPSHSVTFNVPSITSVTNVYIPATHTSVNLRSETYTGHSVDFPYRLIGSYIPTRVIELSAPNLLVYSTTLNSFLEWLLFRSAYSSDVSLTLIYSPILLTTNTSHSAFATPRNVDHMAYTAVYMYPYSTLVAGYLSYAYLNLVLIASSQISTDTTDAVYLYKFVPNLYQYTNTGYSQVPSVRVRSHYDQSSLIIFATVNSSSSTYDAYEGYAFRQNVASSTDTEVYAEHITAYPVEVSVVSQSPITFIYLRPNVVDTVGTGYTTSVARLVRTSTSTSVDASYLYAVPHDLNAYTHTAFSLVKASEVRHATNVLVNARYARRVTHVLNTLVSLLHQTGNLLAITAPSYEVELVSGNVLQDDSTTYTIIVYVRNVDQLNYATYALRFERYPVVSVDYSSYDLHIVAPNVEQSDRIAKTLYILSPGIVQIDSSSKSLGLYGPNLVQRDQSTKSLAVYAPSVQQADRSAYVLRFYINKTLNVTAQVDTTHLVRLYKDRTLALVAGVSVMHAVRLVETQATLSGTAEVEYGAYVV